MVDFALNIRDRLEHHAACICSRCLAEIRAPSPLEIAVACAAIRAGWSKAERISRIADDATRHQLLGWMPPCVETSHLGPIVDGQAGSN